MMTLITRWFEQTVPYDAYRRTDYLLLWIILATGVFLRFWGLGNVGLHGDEETMAMPAMAILDTGHPYLPSGMYYSRALLNIYLMSGSVWLFGESEWAFRLPSALVGSLTGLAAFFMGKRFLSPQYNLAFVATIAMLPAMIEISQTARMYVFFVTCIIWFGACLFRWERNQRPTSLLLAVLVWLLALHFQSLAIFAAPLFLFPGLSRRSWKLLIQGGVAFVVGVAAFNGYSAWISSKYPDETEKPPPPAEEAVSQTPMDVLLGTADWLMTVSVVLIAALAAALLFRIARRGNWQELIPLGLVIAGLLAIVGLQYHAGGILFLFGILFWLRTRELTRVGLLAAVLLAGVLAIAQLAVLMYSGAYDGRQAIGAVVGLPSVWPVLQFLSFSPAAGVLYGIVFVVAIARFANGKPLPMHVFFFAMAVWAPLLMLGFFTVWMPPRYALGQIGFFLLTSFAGLAFLARAGEWSREASRLPAPMVGVLVLVSVALINPVAFTRTVYPDYEMYPDHKGAAEFIRSQEGQDDAVLIAEDVLQQTYYLGEVDYWLREMERVRGYSIFRDGNLVDFYTATKVLGTGEALQEVLDSSGRRDVYVIGSGENFVDGERLFRGEGIAEVLASERLRVVFTGRDGKTKVWKLVR